jgi:ureidoglycolate lyase
VFMKSVSSIAGPDDDVVLPASSSRTDWEVELAIVIGAMARRVPVGEAADCIAGYCMANDVSARDWQMKRAGQWGKGKSFDTFTPVGPWLVTRSSMKDPQSLRLELSVNGVRKQYGSTADMIFRVAEIVSYVSEFMTLAPGDLIITGTPAGVGMGMVPPEFLKAGDLLEMSITGLGTQRHRAA